MKPLSARGHKSVFQAQDFAWILFVGLLLAGMPERNYDAIILLPIIGAFQIIEPRLKLFASRRGQLWSLILKLILSFLLVGYTHTIDSPYYSIFLVPLISAATSYGFAAVLFVTLIASLAYLSFLLPFFIDWSTYTPRDDLFSILCLRVSFFGIVAFIVYEQAQANRRQMARTQEAATRLAESNTNLVQAQVSLRRSERLAALGQLTAGLAHELRNPLGTIKASAEMLTQKSVLDEPRIATEMASYIESEVDRMNSLITSFLNFARPLEIHPVVADLSELVNDVIRHLSPLAAARSVRIDVSVAPDATRFPFDPAVLSIAVLNLLQNAIQASPPGSPVTISASRDDGQVELVVADHGEGISAQNLENIFNPFFTTKPNGVGLGLAIVSKIIDEHQGKITTTSVVGKGTTFRIQMPASTALALTS